MIHEHDTLEVTPIVFKDAKEESKFVKGLCEGVEKDLRDREPLEEKWKVAVAQYQSALQRESGEPQDSQLDVPSTRQFIEMAISRFMNPIFQRKQVYLAKPKEPQYYEIASAFENFADWMVDRSQFRLFVEHFLKQAFIFTKGVCKVPFRVQSKKIKSFFHEIEKDDGTIERHWGLRENDKVQMDVRYVEDNADANPEVIPCQDFITPFPCKNIYTASRITHRVWKSKDEIRRDISRGVYREKDLDGKNILELLGSPTSKPNMDLELSLYDEDDSDSGGSNDGELFEIFEIYTTLKEEEVIVTVERKSQTCLRFVENFYMEDERPFVTWSYEQILNDVDGCSLCYILEPYHRALSAILNQRLDAASRSMEQVLLIDSTLGLGKYYKEGKNLHSGTYTVNTAGSSIKDLVGEFGVKNPFAQIETLEASIKADMQKLASLTDYNAGVEQIERPTATGQVALLEEGKQPQYARMESFRQFLTKVGMMMISRYRQFHPVALKYYIESRDPKEQGLIVEVMRWPKEYWREQIIIEPAVTSENMNKDLRKQELLALVDKMPQILEQLFGLAQRALEPGPMTAIAAKFLDFEIEKILKPFMQEFEVDADDALNLDQEIQIGQVFSQAIQDAQGQIQQLQQSVQSDEVKIGEAVRVLEHLYRQFVAATGKVPQPAPSGKSKATGPITPPTGMGGGPPMAGPQMPGPMA